MPAAYIWAFLSRSAEHPNGNPMCLYGSLLICWLFGCGMSMLFYFRGKWRRRLLWDMNPETTEGSK